jgi:hypothetical protein
MKNRRADVASGLANSCSVWYADRVCILPAVLLQAGAATMRRVSVSASAATLRSSGVLRYMGAIFGAT